MRQVIFVAVFTLSFGYFVVQLLQRYRFIRLGRPENRSDHPWSRLTYLLKQLLCHQKIREYPLSGLFHWPVIWGFIILMFSSLDMALSFLYNYRLPALVSPWFLPVRDIFIVLVIFGVMGFLLRRLFFKPDWLHNSLKAYGILILILVIVLTELCYLIGEAALTPIMNLEFAWLVYPLSQHATAIDKELLVGLREAAFWLHFLAMFSFFYIIPHTKHLHLIFAPFNIYWRSFHPTGRLTTVDLDRETACGVDTIEDFTWKQLLDAFSCVMCGRCHGACPSERSLERLKPKKINGRLRTYLEEEGKQLLRCRSLKGEIAGSGCQGEKEPLKIVGGLFHDDFIWSCTTCGSCNQVCPISIDHLGKIIDMRRNMVVKNKSIPPEVETVFQNLKRTGNILGVSTGSVYDVGREDSLPKGRNLPIAKDHPYGEYLLFLGCQARFNEACQSTGEALIKLLKKADVDFVMLEQEMCCGETIRRMGNEALFQQTAKDNIAQWNQLGVKKIVTGCPHCYNTLKNEYPDFGGEYEVIHYISMVAKLLKEGKLVIPGKLNKMVTYHDPCYLGKHNGIYDEPRAILAAIPGIKLIEMPHNRGSAFCCGGGGGRYWINSSFPNSIKAKRVNEALSTQGQIIVTACSYCKMIMKEEIEKNHPDSAVEVLELSELWARSV